MCHPASFVLTRDSVFWSKTSNSHNAIIREHGLCEDVVYRPTLLRVEISPDNGDYTRPMSEWTYHIDQDFLPMWVDKINDEMRVRAAMLEWRKYHCLCVVKPGVVAAGDCCTVVGGYGARQTTGDTSTQIAGLGAIQNTGLDCTQRARDHACQTALAYAVQCAADDSQQTAGRDSMQTAGMRAQQFADAYATQVARDSSTQWGGNYMTQNAANRANQRAGNHSVQRAVFEALQIAGDYSTQISGPRSVQTAGDGAIQITGNQSIQRAGLGTLQITRWHNGVTWRTATRVIEESLLVRKWQYVLCGVWRNCTQAEIDEIEDRACHAFPNKSND
jgi:hypothetical protein